MREYPEFVFTANSAAYYAWIEEIDPAMFEEIRQRVDEGRWALAGGWWVEPDCNIPSGESLVRQALAGQRFFLQRFGRIATVGVNVDPFGHAATLPQLLRRAGLEGYVFLRPGPHELGLPSPLFRWRAPDGSEVLAMRIPHEYCSPREDLGYHLDKSLAQLPDDFDDMLVFYGVGNHGGGPTRANIESIRALDGSGSLPRLRHSTPEAFFERVRETVADGLPEVEGDLQHHAVGCYSAHSGIKRWNRRAETALGSAEAWAAVASRVTGVAYPRAAFDHAWKQVLFNQFHDTLGGTAIEPAYEDARDQLGEAASAAARAQTVALQAISARIAIPAEGDAQPIVVANPHPWPVRTTVEVEFGALRASDGIVDEAGAPVAFQATQSYATVDAWRTRLAIDAQLPAMGYRTFRVAPGRPRPDESTLVATASSLENEHLRLELDPETGRLTHLVVREAGVDVADLLEGDRARPFVPLDRAVVIDDTSDTWGHRRTAYHDVVGAFAAQEVSLVEAGPARAILRVVSGFGASTLVEDFVLAAGDRAVEVRVILDWQERATLLKLRFATALSDPVATYEIPYGALERPPDGAEEPGQRWVDVCGRAAPDDDGVVADLYGLAVLNDAKHGFDVLGSAIGVTAVRSPIFAHHEPRLPSEGVRYSHQDIGLQRFRLALLPHRGRWGSGVGLARRAAELHAGPSVVLEAAHAGILPMMGSFVAVEPENVVAGALKEAEDGDDVVVRLWETEGRSVRAEVGLHAWNRSFGADLGPWEVRTFAVPRDPARPPREVDLLERPIRDLSPDDAG
jgi:alpha-mannosidase